MMLTSDDAGFHRGFFASRAVLISEKRSIDDATELLHPFQEQ
jgi:hypothetical protein